MLNFVLLTALSKNESFKVYACHTTIMGACISAQGLEPWSTHRIYCMDTLDTHIGPDLYLGLNIEQILRLLITLLVNKFHRLLKISFSWRNSNQHYNIVKFKLNKILYDTFKMKIFCWNEFYSFDN